MTALATYLLAALTAWCPLSRQRAAGEDVDHAARRYEAIAADVAAVAEDPDEPPLRAGADGRAYTGTLILALGFWESAYLERVEVGQCLAWECDGGRAASAWQIHAESGITLDGAGFLYASSRPSDWLLEHLGEVYRGAELVRDRRLAARVALHLARRSVYLWTQGKRAESFARAWVQAHPFATGEQ